MTKRKHIGHHAVSAGRGALAVSYTFVTMFFVSRKPVEVLNVPKKAPGFFARLSASIENSTSQKLSIKEQAFFMKRLAFLIRASVPILEALHMLSEQTTSRRFKKILASVIRDVSNGSSLSKSLGKFPKIFGEFGINIIKVGESSGSLSLNLDYLADELKKRQALRGKVLGALVYPAVIAFATFGITAFLMLYLFPKITPVFASLHAELPLSTRIVMGASTFLQHWGLALLAGIILFAVAVSVTMKRSKAFHFFYDRMLIRIPLFGNMVRYYNLANTTRTLGLLLKSGLTLSEALPLTGDTLKNLAYKREIKGLAVTVNKGERISTYLARDRKLFPEVMSQMVSIGEKSGNLSNTLVYLSELYDAEVDDFTKNLSSLIEPIMMVVMGILVGFIAISIITPIYGITQNIHN